MAIKALIHRFNGLGRKEREKQLPDIPHSASSPSTSSTTTTTTTPSTNTRNTLPPRSPLSIAPGEMARIPQLEPLDSLLPPALLHSIPETTTATPKTPPKVTSSPAADTRRKAPTANAHPPSIPTTADQNGTQKRVAFISPPPTPGPLSSLALPQEGQEPRRRGNSFNGEQRPDLPSKDKPLKARTYSNPSADARPLPSRSAGSRATSRQGTHTPSAPQDPTSLAFSLRSGTPYSHMSTRSFVPVAASWSEAAQGDLVSNLGPRERTRQEVLWEIVTSEERYVQELLKMKETFIDPLLHPFSSTSSQVVPSSPLSGTTFPSLPEEPEDLYRPASHTASASTHPTQTQTQSTASPPESLEHLPIAARFLSPVQDADAPSDGELADSESRRGAGRSPYGRTASAGSRASSRGGAVPFPSRSHQSLPPPPRSQPSAGQGPVSTVSLSPRTPTPASRIIHKLKKRPSPSSDPTSPSLSPQALPEDLRECLTVLERGILGGHVALSEGLKRRYEEQYPLVRSLADVFIQHSHILREYATYVLHLERALEQADAFLSTDVKKKPKKQDAVEWMRISKILQRLEESAADKGETGLSICLSKPFQRLLKYPLLFQNLLFHTDPSTYEYESTLLMVAEVEEIVRSIEDEKILKEERDRTRDVLARIEGLEKNKLLAAPKASRVLVKESPIDVPGSTDSRDAPGAFAAQSQTQSLPSRSVKQKTSFRRLSENVLGATPAMGSKKDLWLVTFNDVALRCQRTGVTTLPLASSTGLGVPGKSASVPDLGGKGKFGSTGAKRAQQTKPRNLYKFVKIETWAMSADPDADPVPKVGAVSMEDVSKTHAKLTQEAIADAGLNADDDGMDSDESDRKSKMSFSYWGADKITVKRAPLSASAPPATGRPGAVRKSAVGAYTRDSPANAKFGNRLRNPDHPPIAGRPMSRTHGPVRRPANGSNEEKPQRPPWGSNPNSAARLTTATARKAQNTPPSSTVSSGTTRKETTPVPESVRTTKYSNAPSEDSGVGLYRQIIAANPSINKLNMM